MLVAGLGGLHQTLRLAVRAELQVAGPALDRVSSPPVSPVGERFRGILEATTISDSTQGAASMESRGKIRSEMADIIFTIMGGMGLLAVITVASTMVTQVIAGVDMSEGPR